METSESEIVYLNVSGILITNTRAVFPQKTYTIAKVTSVTLVKVPPSYLPVVILTLVGVLNLPFKFYVPAIILLSSAIFLLFVLKTRHIVRVRTASGASDAVTSTNRVLME